MNLGWDVLRYMIHSGDPFAALNLESNLQTSRQLVTKSGYLESKIKQYFLDNPHKLEFVMEPTDTYSSRLSKEEDCRLQGLVSSLTLKDKEGIYKQGLELKRIQETKQGNEFVLESYSISSFLPEMC